MKRLSFASPLLAGLLLAGCSSGSSSGGVFANLRFFTQAPVTTGQTPTNAAGGDIDGDGIRDIATANIDDDSVSIFRNTTPPGSDFSSFARTDISVGSEPFDLELVDLDGDGRPELVVSEGGNGTVSVLPNISSAGTVSFSARIVLPASNNPGHLAIADVNGDGLPDIAVARNLANSVRIFLNTTTNGILSFDNGADIGTAVDPEGIAFGDLNRDGRPDLVVACEASDTLTILLNTTAQGASAPAFPTRQDFFPGDGPVDVIVADLNADTTPDIAVANFNDFTVTAFVNQTPRNANLVDLPFVDIYPQVDSPNRLQSGDFDRNGRPDLLVVQGLGRLTSLYLNDINSFSTGGGLQDFTAFIVSADFFTSGATQGGAAVDVDSDLIPDVALTSSPNELTVFLTR